MRTVAVAGGAGFIGSYLVDLLVAKGNRVIVLDNLSTGLKGNINPSAVFIPADLAGAGQSRLAEILRGCEEAWHFAGRGLPAEDLTATRDLVEASARAGVRKVLFASSADIYGECKTRPSENRTGLPVTLNGVAKLAGEGLLSFYCREFGISGISFRLGNVVGGRQRSGFLYELMKQMGSEKLSAEGNPGDKVGYLHVTDCIEGMLSARSSRGALEIYNLGAADSIPAEKITEHVRRKLGAREVLFSGKGSPPSRLNCSKLRSLGWSPKIKSAQAIKRAVEEILLNGGAR
jgi:UDP-glucose 4-epimerase